MASAKISPKQENLVDYLVENGLCKEPRVIQALRETDRGYYTDGMPYSYADHPLGIGLDQTISAPHMHAMCMELLEPALPAGRPGLHVLDIGCGRYFKFESHLYFFFILLKM